MFPQISIHIVLNHLIIIRHLFVNFIRIMKAEEIEIAHEKEAISISISKEMKAWLSMGDIKPILNTEYLAHKFQGG